MKSRHFCFERMENMKKSETLAFDSWRNMMNRGMSAYTDCRTDSAYLYFSSAADIAILRSRCLANQFFTAQSLIKPAEFIVQLLVLDQRFDLAIMFLSRLSSTSCERFVSSDMHMSEFLAVQYERIDTAEKQCQTPKQSMIKLFMQANQAVYH